MHVADRILLAIGPEAMRKLCREFGGSVLYVPQGPPQPQRDDNILRLFSDSVKNGASNMTAYERCADEFDLSVRNVQRIVAKG